MTACKKKGNTIGRIIWVPPSTQELFYMRMMLTVSQGPTTYEEIRTIANIVYSTFKEACLMAFLQDDKEFVEAIRKAKGWGSGYLLRKLFVTMLLSNNTNNPENVWAYTWEWLSDVILF